MNNGGRVTMEIVNYVRKCKKAEGYELHSTRHAADNKSTFCGKELNVMWFVESSAGLQQSDVTCRECLKVMRQNV